MKGRKPRPTFLRVLEGNRGRRPFNADEPIPTGVIGDPPPWMNAQQQRVWRDGVLSAPVGLLTNIDASIFTVWVCAVVQHQEAVEKVNQYGAVVKQPGTGQPIKSPFLTIRQEEAKLIKQMCSEIGFSPTARPRAKVQKSKTGTIFDELKEID